MKDPLLCACRTFELPNGYGLYEDGFIHTVDCCPVVRLRDMAPITPPATPAVEQMTDEALRAAIKFHKEQAARYRNEAAKIWRLRVRMGDPTEEDRQRAAALVAVAAKPNTPSDLVVEARELLNSHAYILIQPRTRQLLGQLCDEVERLRKHVKDLNHDLEATIKEQEAFYRRMMHDNA